MKRNGFPARLGAAVIKFRWLVIVGSVLVAMAAGSGGKHLGFSDDERAFFGKDNPQLKSLEKLENTYTKDENVIFAIAPDNGNAFTRETLSVVEEITDLAWMIPFSSRVDSITNFQHTWADGDDLVVGNLVENAMNLSDADLERIREIALAEPLLIHRLIPPRGHVTAVNINFLFPGKSPNEGHEVVLAVRKMADELRSKHPEIKVYLTGGVMISNAFFEASQDDMSKLMPLMLLLMTLVMWITLRSITGTLATVLIIAFSAVTAMGITGYLGILITPVSAMAPTIIMTLAIADSIHLLVTMFHEMRLGKTKHEAIIESVRINLQPIFLTSITTAIGFLSMNFSDAPPFHDLGNIVAIGVMAAFFYSALFLPAVMSVLPVRVKAVSNANNIFMDRLADFVVNHRDRLLWGMAVLIVALSAGISQIELDDKYIDYFDDRYAFRTDTDFVTDNLTNLDMLEFSLSAGEEGGISNPEYLAKLEEFAIWLRQQPEVLHVTSITDIMKRLNMNMHGDDPAYYRVPQNRELAAQYLLLYEMSLPFGLDLNNQIDVGKSATRFRVIMHDIFNKDMREIENRSENWLRKNAPEHMFSYGIGLSIMFAHITERNVKSMLKGTAFALVLISGILMFALRSFRIGLISLIPNLVPAAMAFGLWGLTVSRVGLAVSVVAAMSLGIVVDDTIHFLSKYLRARRETGSNPQDGVRYSFHTVGKALVVTTIILMSGFFVLTLSGFKINATMGLLTAIAIGFALLVDFMFLPPLLMKMERDKN